MCIWSVKYRLVCVLFFQWSSASSMSKRTAWNFLQSRHAWNIQFYQIQSKEKMNRLSKKASHVHFTSTEIWAKKKNQKKIWIFLGLILCAINNHRFYNKAFNRSKNTKDIPTFRSNCKWIYYYIFGAYGVMRSRNKIDIRSMRVLIPKSKIHLTIEQVCVCVCVFYSCTHIWNKPSSNQIISLSLNSISHAILQIYIILQSKNRRHSTRKQHVHYDWIVMYIYINSNKRNWIYCIMKITKYQVPNAQSWMLYIRNGCQVERSARKKFGKCEKKKRRNDFVC